MACIRKRRGRYVVDYRDGSGIRRWATCRTYREAEIVLSDKLRESRQPTRSVVDLNITVDGYAVRWEELIAASVKRRTLDSYRDNLRLYIKPALGPVRVRQLNKGQIKSFLAAKLKTGLSRNSVRIMHATLRAMLNAAVDDGVILANPAERLGRQLRLVPSASARQEEIKAMTREQLASFLATASTAERRLFPLFLLSARTGMRLGEAVALQWADIDTSNRAIRVARAFSDGELSTPKSGHGRDVDMSQQLATAMRRLLIERKTEALKRGWAEIPAWIFCSEAGTPLDTANVRRVFVRLLKRAKLPMHFTPHSLRHTFASLLLQQGESPAYVQRQLGHASIKLTVDTYGKWLPMGNKAAVDRLDEPVVIPSGSKTVAGCVFGGTGTSELSELSGAGGGS